MHGGFSSAPVMTDQISNRRFNRTLIGTLGSHGNSSMRNSLMAPIFSLLFSHCQQFNGTNLFSFIFPLLCNLGGV
jgi:hypothetical protein